MNLLKLIEEIDRISIDDNIEAIQFKFDLIKSGLDYIGRTQVSVTEEVLELLKRIHWFGYEIGHSKATEIYATDYHRPLVMEGLEIIRKIPPRDKRVSRIFKDALVYTYDLEEKKKIEEEIKKIESGI